MDRFLKRFVSTWKLLSPRRYRNPVWLQSPFGGPLGLTSLINLVKLHNYVSYLTPLPRWCRLKTACLFISRNFYPAYHSQLVGNFNLPCCSFTSRNSSWWSNVSVNWVDMLKKLNIYSSMLIYHFSFGYQKILFGFNFWLILSLYFQIIKKSYRCHKIS